MSVVSSSYRCPAMTTPTPEVFWGETIPGLGTPFRRTRSSMIKEASGWMPSNNYGSASLAEKKWMYC